SAARGAWASRLSAAFHRYPSPPLRPASRRSAPTAQAALGLRSPTPDVGARSWALREAQALGDNIVDRARVHHPRQRAVHKFIAQDRIARFRPGVAQALPDQRADIIRGQTFAAIFQHIIGDALQSRAVGGIGVTCDFVAIDLVPDRRRDGARADN